MHNGLRPCRRVDAALSVHGLPRRVGAGHGCSGPCVPHCVRPRTPVIASGCARLLRTCNASRLLVLRSSHRTAFPPTSRSVGPLGFVDGSMLVGSILEVIGFRCATLALRAQGVARDATCGVWSCSTGWTDCPRSGVLRVTRHVVARSACGSVADRVRAEPVTKYEAQVSGRSP